jgi:outer membrane lipoprotein-sorting protein
MTEAGQRRRWARRWPWVVPAVTAGVVLAGAQLMSPATATAHPNLPPRTPAQLLAAAQTSTVRALSGTVTETAALGLPQLPGADGAASLSWQALLVGSHTARVWIDGPAKQRIALLGTLSESDVVHNGRDVWTYDSQRNQVTHTVLPARRGERPDEAAPGTTGRTPMDVANRILKAIDPSTAVSVDTTQVVAGHDAYTLVLAPRSADSTVRKVTIALDSRRFVPLQVQVYGAGSGPAFQIGFVRDLSFGTPPASEFEFHAPPGATTVTNPLTGPGRHRHAPEKAGTATPPPPANTPTKPRIIGSGWTAIAYFAHGLPAVAQSGLLGQAFQPVGSTGDRLLSTALLNVLMTPDGRVFAGAVTPSLLEQAAATTPR